MDELGDAREWRGHGLGKRLHAHAMKVSRDLGKRLMRLSVSQRCAGAILAAVALWFVSGSLGIGMGYHRLLTHRGFKTPKWVEYFLTVWSTGVFDMTYGQIFTILFVLIVALSGADLVAGTLGLVVVSCYVALVITNFAWMYPILTGIPISQSTWNMQIWLPSWR